MHAIDPTIPFREYDPATVVANETVHLSDAMLAVLRDPAQCPPIVKGVLTHAESERLPGAELA